MRSPPIPWQTCALALLLSFSAACDDGGPGGSAADASVTVDQALPIEDMTPPVADMAPPVEDLAPPIDDMAPPVEDMAPPIEDMAPPPEDMAPPPEDMAPPPEDMAPPPEDMAPPPVDMAVVDAAPVCPRGDEDCPCGVNDFCRGDLVCTDGICLPDACADGSEGCPCDADRCDEGLACERDVCVPCTHEIEGCPCDDEDACGEDLVCDADSVCIVPEICADLRCAPEQLCREPELAGELPRCLPECVAGFDWNPETLACDPEPPPGERCDPDAANSIAARCAAENRRCDEPVMGEAICGACIEGFVADGERCRAPRGCDDLDCAAQNRGCQADPGVDATCQGCLEGFVEEGGACVPPPPPGCDALDCGAQNRVCVPGDLPACGACQAGFVEQMGQCVPDISANCEAGAPGDISPQCAAQQRICLDMAGGAVCAGCVAGFAERLGACEPEVLCGDLNCEAMGRQCGGEPFARCGACADGFVEVDGMCQAAVHCANLDCDQLGRTCDGDPFAACGACLPGTEPADPDDPRSPCVAPLRCADIACEAGEFCLEGRDGGDAFCSDAPCGPGEALREDQNRCVVCDLLCGEPGETGNVYPYTQAFSDNCVCETESGFYADVAGAIRARPCDADGDGWVRISAQASIESDDEAIRSNARCNLRQAYRVEFVNEYGQYRTVRFCEEGLRRPWEGNCDDVSPTPLYESVRNDDPVELARDPDAPDYLADGAGRRLRAAELNPLTKACVSAFADYNDNGIADVAEHQAAEAPDDLEPALRAWLPFTHFVELHHTLFWRPANQNLGTLSLRERSRCADDFPLTYAEGEGSWWRQCHRNRAADYTNDLDALVPTSYDFAQYTCGQNAGTCALAGPPTNAPTLDAVPAHGLCDSARTNAGGWHGINHASQFRCVQVSAPEELPENRQLAPHRVLASELYDGVDSTRVWQFNRCHIACPEDDANCAADCDDAGCAVSSLRPNNSNPARPVLSCEAIAQDDLDRALPPGTVGFAAVRYIDSPGDYRMGCIDEWTPGDAGNQWKGLCPGYDANPRAVVGQSNPRNFGRILCGCGFGYGGPECALGCPSRAIDTDGDGSLETDAGPLHYGGTHLGETCHAGYCPIGNAGDDGGRMGVWLCGDTSVTSPPQGQPRAEGGGYSLFGRISPQAFDATPLCQGEDCDRGWSVRKDPRLDR